jgi:hypothetical protein
MDNAHNVYVSEHSELFAVIKDNRGKGKLIPVLN